MNRKNSFLILFPLFYIPWNEAIFSLFLRQGITFHKCSFALLAGLFLYWLGQLTYDRRRAFWMQTVFAVICTGVYMVQVSYYTLFETPFYLKSLGGAGDAMSDFFSILVDTVVSVGPALLLMGLYFVLWLTVYRKYFLTVPYSTHRSWRSLLLFTAWLCLSVSIAILDYNGAISSSYMMLHEFVPTESVRKFGMLPTAFLDIKYNILHLQTTRQETIRLDMDTIEIEPADEGAPSTAPTKGSSESETTESIEGPAQEAVLELPGNTSSNTSVYSSDEYNIMDLDFAKELQKEEELRDETYTNMNEYFSSLTPTKKNTYTGMFAGKNLILITAEAFSRFAINPELTPTLYRLSTEGFIFNHFYTPIWGVSTSDGEFVATTGLIPQAGVWSYTEIADNYMPFAFGNQFRSLGYLTEAYHDHSYTYYNRDQSYPNMGYDFLAKDHGLDITDTWPESDVELVEQTVPRYLTESNQPFHVYYMTVSGHFEYKWNDNAMAWKNRSRVAQLDLCEECQAYLACQLELEDALTKLLVQLEKAGELENTVIALSGDHYPYGLSLEQYRELRGEDFDETFGLYENTFLLWSASMEEPVTVDTYCSSLDIAPTLSNLFGLTYDSRLYIGTDIFSDTPPIVCFQDRSFITQRIMYDNTNEKIVTLGGDNVSEEYLADCIAKVKNKFYYSARIIETDYYGYLFDK